MQKRNNISPALASLNKMRRSIKINQFNNWKSPNTRKCGYCNGDRYCLLCNKDSLKHNI